MNPHPDSVFILVDIRHHDLQAEAARYRLAREAYGDGFTVRAAMSTARRQLDVTLVRVRQHLDSVRWTPALPRRGAFSR
jgi:hypothetical protein